MEHRQQLQSEIVSHIKGLENVHCVLNDPDVARSFYAELFGPPAHTDGEWSEFKVAGFDFAVTKGEDAKFVITFKVDRLDELCKKLEQKLSAALLIEHGDYGDYIEISPAEGFCLHFFEARSGETLVNRRQAG